MKICSIQADLAIICQSGNEIKRLFVKVGMELSDYLLKWESKQGNQVVKPASWEDERRAQTLNRYPVIQNHWL